MFAPLTRSRWGKTQELLLSKVLRWLPCIAQVQTYWVDLHGRSTLRSFGKVQDDCNVQKLQSLYFEQFPLCGAYACFSKFLEQFASVDIHGEVSCPGKLICNGHLSLARVFVSQLQGLTSFLDVCHGSPEPSWVCSHSPTLFVTNCSGFIGIWATLCRQHLCFCTKLLERTLSHRLGKTFLGFYLFVLCTTGSH